MYQDLMKADLAKLLESGLIQGKNPRVLARELKKSFNTSTFNAERLMRSELARVQTEAQKQSFERNGFEEYEFIVNGGCCPICEGLSGKHFKVAKMMPGENAPPMHPHCRCSTAAYSDRKEYEEWLNYLEKGGTTEEYNKRKKSEREESKPKYAHKETVIDSNIINSADYRRRIDNISDNTEVNRSIWNRAKEILSHRTGTKFEDLAFVDSITGKSLINKGYDQENRAMPSKRMQEMLSKSKPYTIIGIHNHPGSSVPSLADIRTCMDRKYKCGVVLCHNGSIYVYSVNSDRFNEPICVSALAFMEKIGYNDTVKTMFKDAGIEMGVL